MLGEQLRLVSPEQLYRWPESPSRTELRLNLERPSPACCWDRPCTWIPELGLNLARTLAAR